MGSSQSYVDRYDLMTIQRLRELEKILETSMDEADLFLNRRTFLNTGVYYARHKEETIRQWINDDERNERLKNEHTIPKSFNCNICGLKMRFEKYLFDFRGVPILFVFDCPGDHRGRKVLYPDGKQYILPERKCSICNGLIQTKVEQIDNVHRLTIFCTNCNNTIIDEVDVGNEHSIDEIERKKYCDEFINKKTYDEELIEIGKLIEWVDEQTQSQSLKQELGLKDINKLTIPQLEALVLQAVKSEGFIKFQLDNPIVKVNVTVPFNLQDSTDRTEKKSTNFLKRIVKNALFNTNWEASGR